MPAGTENKNSPQNVPTLVSSLNLSVAVRADGHGGFYPVSARFHAANYEGAD